MQKGKQTTSTEVPSQGDSHSFTLKRVVNTFCGPSVHVNFSPLSPSSSDKSLEVTKTHPIFNKDNLYFTPAFLLETDKTKTKDNLTSYLKLHENRIKELSQQKQEMYVACPSRSNSFCCICRVYFDDYLEHVVFPNHVKLMKQSQYNKDIEGMTQRFSELHPQPYVAPQRKTRGIKKQRKTGVNKRNGTKLDKMAALPTSTCLSQELLVTG